MTKEEKAAIRGATFLNVCHIKRLEVREIPKLKLIAISICLMLLTMSEGKKVRDFHGQTIYLQEFQYGKIVSLAAIE